MNELWMTNYRINILLSIMLPKYVYDYCAIVLFYVQNIVSHTFASRRSTMFVF